MNQEKIENLLHQLSDRLIARGLVGEIALYGGAAMVLAHRARLSTKDVVTLQQPTLPDKPISPKKFQITLISGMLSVFVLLVWAFLRAALRAVSNDPECASKLARIRRGVLGR